MNSIRSAVLLGALLSSAVAFADPPSEEQSPAAAPGVDYSSEAPVFSGWSALGESELGLQRAGDELLSVQESVLNATVSGNTAGAGIQTGAITVSDGAFSASRGIQSSLFNSGNNVSIQSSMTINVQLQ